jgi:hypothetical protein
MPPTSASPAGDTQQESLLGDDTTPPAPPVKKPRPSRARKQRTPEEQQRYDQAHAVADWWWKECDNAGLPKIGKTAGSNGFPGLVKMLESALADDYSQREVADALLHNRKRFPSLTKFEDALMAVRGIAAPPQTGAGQQRVATSDLRVSQVRSLMADFRQAAADGRVNEWMATPETLTQPGQDAPTGPAVTPGGSW